MTPSPASAGDGGEPAGRFDIDTMLRDDAAHAGPAVGERARNEIRDILEERTAEGDVGDLDAAANRKHRYVALARGAHQIDLIRVALGRGGLGLRVPLRLVALRVDVQTAGEAEPVDPREVGRDRARIVLEEARLGASGAQGGEVLGEGSGVARPSGHADPDRAAFQGGGFRPARGAPPGP
jgi:hypothetical protein